MNLRYIYIYLDIYIYISRSNIINLSVYEFINFRYMNVTLNVVVPVRFQAGGLKVFATPAKHRVKCPCQINMIT